MRHVRWWVISIALWNLSETGPTRAQAQDAKAPAKEPADAGPLAPAAGEGEEEILVTGSRIKRTSFDTPTPVQVLNRDAIARSGASNMADLIRILTANSGSETQAGLGQGSITGSSQFNLRNLGVPNTLVLLNGRRLVPYPFNFGVANGSTFSDVNQIPLSFVERIEIAKGGASAIYGSDAIAGVVNIILRKDFEGVAVSVSGFTTDDRDQQDGEISVIAGASSEKSSIVAQFSYFQRSPLAAADRDFTAGTFMSPVGNPGNYFYAADGAFPDPGCGKAGSASRVNPTTGLCDFDFRDHINLYNQEERILAYVTAEHRASRAFQLFGEFGFAHKSTLVSLSPSFPATSPPPVLVLASHPDWPFAATNPDVQGAVFSGSPLGRAAGSFMQPTRVDGFRAVGGLKGELDELELKGWSWETAITWHVNELLQRTDDAISGNLQNAINACADPMSQIPCFNPFYSSVDGTGTVNTSEALDYIFGTLITDVTNTLVVADASISGPLVALPGGNLAIALGGQVRHDNTVLRYDHDTRQKNFAYLYGLDPFRASVDVLAGYAELSIPAWSGFELQGAIRAEHHVDVETTINPRIAASWALDKTFVLPEDLGIRLRGSLGTAFRAPNVAQLNQTGIATEQFDLNGPDVAEGTQFRTSITHPNPDLKPETSTAFSAGAEATFEGLLVDGDFWQYDVSNLIIQENARRFFENCRLLEAAGNYSEDAPECVNLAGPPSEAGTIVNVSYRNQSSILARGIDLALSYKFGLGEAGDLIVGAGGTWILNYLVPRSEVLDIRSDTNGDGIITEDEIHTPPDCDENECDLAGKRNLNANGPRSMPRLRARIPITWTAGGHMLNLAANYISGYLNDGATEGVTYAEIPPWMTFDLSYSYVLGETSVGTSTQFRIGINNLLDTAPPFLGTDTNFGYDIFVHDPRGRIVHANLTHKF